MGLDYFEFFFLGWHSTCTPYFFWWNSSVDWQRHTHIYLAHFHDVKCYYGRRFWCKSLHESNFTMFFLWSSWFLFFLFALSSRFDFAFFVFVAVFFFLKLAKATDYILSVSESTYTLYLQIQKQYDTIGKIVTL